MLDQLFLSLNSHGLYDISRMSLPGKLNKAIKGVQQNKLKTSGFQKTLEE